MNSKILLGLSGGVDSAYTALSLKESGYEVIGVNLLMHEAADTRDKAMQASKEIGIPLEIIDAREDFKNNVISRFISEYLSGRTPNPCVICNETVKLCLLYNKAIELSAPYIATGHYAGITMLDNGRYAVLRAADKSKDQSYFLYRLSQEYLAALKLPLSNVIKKDMRLDAEKKYITASSSKESQEICFLPDNGYADFIIKHCGCDVMQGNYIDKNGSVLGLHKGIINYTVGQRKGLGIALGKPAFVTKIDAHSNTVTLGFADDCFCSEFFVDNLVFQGTLPFDGDREYGVKIRYRAAAVKCYVWLVENGLARVRLEAPARAVTPGQSAVFYDGEAIAFGGYIK